MTAEELSRRYWINVNNTFSDNDALPLNVRFINREISRKLRGLGFRENGNNGNRSLVLKTLDINEAIEKAEQARHLLKGELNIFRGVTVTTQPLCLSCGKWLPFTHNGTCMFCGSTKIDGAGHLNLRTGKIVFEKKEVIL